LYTTDPVAENLSPGRQSSLALLACVEQTDDSCRMPSACTAPGISQNWPTGAQTTITSHHPRCTGNLSYYRPNLTAERSEKFTWKQKIWQWLKLW